MIWKAFSVFTKQIFTHIHMYEQSILVEIGTSNCKSKVFKWMKPITRRNFEPRHVFENCKQTAASVRKMMYDFSVEA